MEGKDANDTHDEDTSGSDRDCGRLVIDPPDSKSTCSTDMASMSNGTTHFLDKESALDDRDTLTGIMNDMIRDIVPKLDENESVNLTASELAEKITEVDKEESASMRRPPSLFETCHKQDTGDDESCLQTAHPQMSVFPPSGPFVVGDQMDIMAEAFAGKFLDASTSSQTTGLLLDSSPLQSPTSFESNPFLKWLPRTADQGTFSLRRTLEYHGLGSRAPPRQQKGRTDLSLSDRVRLINMSESTGKSQRTLAAEFHISVGSVNNILRRKREYLEAFEKTEKQTSLEAVEHKEKQPSTKKFSYSLPAAKPHKPSKPSSPGELHLLLVRWVEIARLKAKVLSWPIIMEKAREFAARLNISNFTSAPWLEHLKQTLDLSLSPLAGQHGVSSESDAKLLAMWQKMMPFLVQGYDPENIFSVTETALYYKCLPDKCFVGGPICKGSQSHADMLEHRLTVLLCCNTLGERLKPLVISRHSQPDSLAGVQMTELPVVWCHQPDGIITTEIFAGWLRSLDSAMGQQRRQIALFMDMAPSHLASVLLKHTSLKFFLDNSSHLLQPLSQGVVRTFKAYYRRRLLQAALAHAISGDCGPSVSHLVSELDVVFWIQDAWSSISLETIASSFQAAAFPHSADSTSSDTGLATPEPLPSDLHRLAQRCGNIFKFTPMSVDVYVEFDSPVPCHHGDTEEWENLLVSEVLGRRIKSEPEESCGENSGACSRCSPTEDEKARSNTTTAEALDCLQKLKQFSVSNIGVLTTVYELESLILDSLNTTQHSGVP